MDNLIQALDEILAEWRAIAIKAIEDGKSVHFHTHISLQAEAKIMEIAPNIPSITLQMKNEDAE